MAKLKKDFDVSAKLPLHGKRIAFTGALSAVKRRQASAIAHELGAEVTNTVSRKTDYVVVGAEPGKKLEAAKEKGVPVLSEDAFFDLVRKQRDEVKAARAIVAKLGPK
jgi:DNA ligase (NAD+)